MAENQYIRNGAIAGFVSGIVTGVLTYLTMPSVEEVLRGLEKTSYVIPVTSISQGYLALALRFSGIIVVVVMFLLGILFGWLHEYIDSRTNLKTRTTALLSGIVLTALLTIPNIAMGGSLGKTLLNFISGITYTIVLVLLAIFYWSKEESMASEKSEWY